MMEVLLMVLLAKLMVMDYGNEIWAWKNRNLFVVVAVVVEQLLQPEQPKQMDQNSTLNVSPKELQSMDLYLVELV